MAKEQKKAAETFVAGGGSPNYYQVTIKPGMGFFTNQTQFLPGNTYTVSAAIYNGTIDGSSANFADQCATALPLTIPQTS